VFGYVLAAVFLGIVLTLVPLIARIEPEQLNVDTARALMTEQFSGLEGRHTIPRRTADLTDATVVLSVGFILASAGYVFSKRRIAH
jgi:hypothetical protein